MERHNKNSNQNLEKRIIIAERDNIAAVMENGKVSDFIISRGDVILGDVYLGFLSSNSGLDKENYRGTNIERNVLNIISAMMIVIASLLLYYIETIMPAQYVSPMHKIQLFAMFSGVFILLYNGYRGYNKKWFQYGSYLYYPIHIGIIFLIFTII